MPKIEMKDIDYFLAVAEQKNVTKAAEVLFISQPALTKYLRTLESRMGVELFDHSKRPLELTPMGNVYYKYAKEIVANRYNLENELNNYQDTEPETIRIGFSDIGLRNHLFDAIKASQQKHPHVRFLLSDLGSHGIEKKILEEEIDLGLIIFPANNPGLSTRLLFEEDILLAVPKNHKLSNMGTTYLSKEYPVIDLGLFRNERFVLREDNTRFWAHTKTLFQMANVEPNGVLTARNSSFALEYAESLGLCTLTTESHVRGMTDPGSMRFFIAGPCPIKLYSGIVYKTSRVLSMNILRFMEEINQTVSAANKSFRFEGPLPVIPSQDEKRTV